MKPVFTSIIDLGLRDVGVRNEPRKLAAHLGRMSVPLLALAVIFGVGICVLVSQLGAGRAGAFAFAAAWTVIVLALVVRGVKRSPPVVVKVTSAGTNQASRLLMLLQLPLAAVALLAVVRGDLLLIPVVAVSVLMTLLVFRARGRVPAALRDLEGRLERGEEVLGDGIGIAKGVRGPAAVRVIVATDRRLLVPGAAIDAPYSAVSRFGIAWRTLGRMGELSLTVDGEEHVVTGIAPANLLSIARVLEARGAAPDDPDALHDAMAAWEAALWESRERSRLFDGEAMRTRAYDQGLWLLLGLTALVLYVNPFGIGLGQSRDWLPALVGVLLVCAACGYVSGTRASLAYLVPLNLMVAPAFFFTDASDALALMLVFSALATVGLWVGSGLGRPISGPAVTAARGSLRYTLGGVSLVRLSAGLLAALLALVGATAAAGFELTSLRLAVDERIYEQLPVDGRSNLTGGAASLTYTPGEGLLELVTDEEPLAGPADGARWELRSTYRLGQNSVTLGHYVIRPRLDTPAAVAAFVAEKDRAHSRLAGFRVGHTRREVDGRTGYVWSHGSRSGYWYYAAWFPDPVHSVRVECISRRDKQRFQRLCGEAMASLELR